MNSTELFLDAMLGIFIIPWFVRRLFRVEKCARLVVVQSVTGIILRPGALGHGFPTYCNFVCTPRLFIHSMESSGGRSCRP